MKLDLQKFMGDWYVIARIPTFFETGSVNAMECYSWNKQNQRIDVDYHHNVGGPRGPVRHYPQKAWVSDLETNCEWKIQFFWPLKFTSRIEFFDPDYQWSILGTPSKKNVWVLSRKPVMDESLFLKLAEDLRAIGYNIDKLKKVPQIWD
jgi:apolipoprotein D and lipocalin family protein